METTAKTPGGGGRWLFAGDHAGGPASRLPAAVAALVAAASVGGAAAVFLGLDLGLAGASGSGAAAGTPARLVHVALDWGAALVALVLALLAAAGGSGSRGGWHPAVPASAWLSIAVLDAWHGSLELVSTPGAAGMPRATAFTWLVSRLVLGLGLVWSGWALGRGGRLRERLGIPALALSLTGIAVSVGGVLSGRVPPLPPPLGPFRDPLAAGVLALLVVAGLGLLPGVWRKGREMVAAAAWLGVLPLAVAEAELAFGGGELYGAHFVLAHGQRLLAYMVLLGGLALDYGRARRGEAEWLRQAEAAERTIEDRFLQSRDLARAREREVVERRRAERTLSTLEKAAETMSLGLTVTDPQGRILFVNPADARMHGYRVEELIGRQARIFNPAGKRSVPRLSREISRWERERLNVRKDGTTFPVRLVSDAVYDADGQLAAVVTLCEDISERRRIQEALERRDRILQAVGVAAERFLAETPWEERVGEVLERLGLATGVDRVYFGSVDELGHPLPGGGERSWTSPQSRVKPTGPGSPGPAPPYLFEGWRQRLARGQTLRGRVDSLPRMERAPLADRGVRSYAVVPIFVRSAWWGFLGLEDSDSEREWSRAEIEALRVAARTLAAAIRRQQTVEALAASEERYREVLESANDLIHSVGSDGRFQYVNRAWRETLGYGEEEVRRLTIADIVAAESLPGYQEVLRGIVAGEKRGRVEATFVSRTGKEIPVEGSLACRMVRGKVVAVRGIFRDISERLAVDQLKQDFISTISHDLRTPLTSMIAALDLLNSGLVGDDPERGAELVDVAHRNSTRLLRLINDLLDLQKLSAGKMRFVVGEVAVRPVLMEAAQGFKAFADAAHVRLEVGEVPSGLEVLADRDRLMQVMSNLLSNAVKFSPSGAAVSLDAVPRDGRVVLSVRDRGPGIPESFRHRLFDRFSQADPSASYRTGGSGLGLSIVKALVEGMRGEISLETEVGKGTTFHVSLPAAPTWR